MSKQIVPVFYACDDAFVKYTMVSLCSLMENASKDFEYNIHILHTNICEENRKAVLGMAKPGFHICFEDVSERIRAIGGSLPLRDYYSLTTYYRLFIPEMFPQYDKAIYVDSDTVIEGDFAELYATDLQDNLVGAVVEQVMVQVDVYGTYAEEVTGVDRNKFFNAGLLLINCKKFREENVLERFKELLYTYRFAVTQDEDYLNVICKDRVCYLPATWNVEVFGDILCEEKDIKLFHYIMVSKPWHYEDARFADHFWKYAKQAPCYEEIKRELAEYTDEERERDAAVLKNLESLAWEEISREDNYYNLVNKQGKSIDRIIVLNKIAQYEKEGRFDEDVEEDPPTRELLPNEIDYLRKKGTSKIKSKFAYTIARKFMNSLIEDKKMIIKEIKGIENYRDLNSGAIVTCNHFNAYDSFAMQIAYEASGQHKKRKLFRVIREGNYTNFPGFYGVLMRNCNTFPLSSNMQTMRKFMSCMDEVLKEGHFMLIYPEQSMWWNYRKPKPLKEGAFKFAVRNNVPVLPCFITMEDSNILDENGFFVQEYTIHVGAPIYPDPALNRKKNVEEMARKNYELWKNIYETTYHETLEYTCGKVD